ncbi:MAG: pilT [Pseudonocardiales bacterium]|nr:pilT [Jatrophihabitantaceae bacterium]MCW2602731.1 pilT [Pseudonocardiales bacterium]
MTLDAPLLVAPRAGQSHAADAPSMLASPLPGDLEDLLRQMLALGSSDLHLSAGIPPSARVHGDIRRLEGWPVLQPEHTEALVRSVLTSQQWSLFAATSELDLAVHPEGLGRFRVNVMRQKGAVGAVMRAIPTKMPALTDLLIPAVVSGFADLPRGLVLVTGPTGSGKSTTLAAIIDEINANQRRHIVTIEDPIEFVHSSKRGIVNQREVGSDTTSFATALRAVLRQDPDVILLGEMRDHETAAAAITAAETGHLVFATLHTQSAAQTIDRLIDMFPPAQQNQVRSQLGVALRGIVTQALLPRRDGQGRVVAVEILMATPAIRNLIREGLIHQIPSAMQAGGRSGMITFDQHLAQRVRESLITIESANLVAQDRDELRRLIGRG